MEKLKVVLKAKNLLLITILVYLLATLLKGSIIGDILLASLAFFILMTIIAFFGQLFNRKKSE